MSRTQFLLILLFSLFALFWFGRPLLEVFNRMDRIESLRAEVAGLKTEKEDLSGELAFLRSPAFVEQEARNRLDYSRAGEKVLIMPPLVQKSNGGEATASMTVEPVYQQWFNLFIK